MNIYFNITYDTTNIKEMVIMLSKKIIIISIILLFLTCGFASAFSLFGDGLDPEDIYVDEFENTIIKYTDQPNDYMYSIHYDLGNFSTSLEGCKVITYLYDNDTVLYFNYTIPIENEDDIKIDEDGDGEYDAVYGKEENFPANNTTEIVEDVTDGSNKAYLSPSFFPDELVNVTHVKIEIVQDDKVIFNTSHPFDMGSYKEENLHDTTSSDESTTESNSDYQATYVASSDSDKFHDPFCSQAQRIKEANKITFSSRDEAISAGYEPCEICYP